MTSHASEQTPLIRSSKSSLIARGRSRTSSTTITVVLHLDDMWRQSMIHSAFGDGPRRSGALHGASNGCRQARCALHCFLSVPFDVVLEKSGHHCSRCGSKISVARQRCASGFEQQARTKARGRPVRGLNFRIAPYG